MVASTGVLRIGGNSVWGEWFAGLIDEVRVYNRPLSAAEIQQDSLTPVGGSPPPPDTLAPSAPSGVSALASVGSVALGWAASSDNVAVVRYNVHRSQTAGFTPAAGNRIAQPVGTGYTDSGLAGGTYYYRVDRRGRGRQCQQRLSGGVGGRSRARNRPRCGLRV